MDSFPGYVSQAEERRFTLHKSMEENASSWQRIDHKTFRRRFVWGLEAAALCAFLAAVVACL